jgi:hypothetical protein
MPSVLFQNAMALIANGDLDLGAANLDARLLMTNTTADTEPDATTVGGITTLDECDATGYAIEDVTSPAATAVDASDLMKFASDNWVWSGLGGDATRDYQGALLVQYVDGSTGDIPILFVDFTADVTKAATQVTAPCPASGWLTIGQPT